MNGDPLALAVGTVLAVGALAFVLFPLFFGSAEPPPAARAPVAPRDDEGSALRALREIEFDRATGKLSDADYASLRATYAGQALRELRGPAGAAGAPGAPGAADEAISADDDIEARVLAYRAARRECGRCGLRPEPDAIFCSSCGGYLARSCPQCASPVVEESPAFCSTCGVTLAAPQPA